MCFVSAVFDEWSPYTPRPEPWKGPFSPKRLEPKERSYPWTVIPGQTVKLDPTQLKELIDAFHEAVKAAETFDRITGQPDCEDPEKAKLRDRVAELEGLIAEFTEKATK